MDDALWAAYRATDYRVLTTPPLVLAVDRTSVGLACLFKTHQVSDAVFITAWNPLSQRLDDTVNEVAQAGLEARLKTLTRHVLPGEGRARLGAWLPEPSFLALGIGRSMAVELGREFKQNAVVWSGADACPRLIACV